MVLKIPGINKAFVPAKVTEIKHSTFNMMLEDYLASADLGQDTERLKIYFGCQGHYPSYQYMNYFTTRCHGGWKFGIKVHEAVAERLAYLSEYTEEIRHINDSFSALMQIQINKERRNKHARDAC